jgi:hypothetical protein
MMIAVATVLAVVSGGVGGAAAATEDVADPVAGDDRVQPFAGRFDDDALLPAVNDAVDDGHAMRLYPYGLVVGVLPEGIDAGDLVRVGDPQVTQHGAVAEDAQRGRLPGGGQVRRTGVGQRAAAGEGVSPSGGHDKHGGAFECGPGREDDDRSVCRGIQQRLDGGGVVGDSVADRAVVLGVELGSLDEQWRECQENAFTVAVRWV